jgi:hypothetical protein
MTASAIGKHAGVRSWRSADVSMDAGGPRPVQVRLGALQMSRPKTLGTLGERAVPYM